MTVLGLLQAEKDRAGTSASGSTQPALIILNTFMASFPLLVLATLHTPYGISRVGRLSIGPLINARMRTFGILRQLH
jgi:hypothetical protein